MPKSPQILICALVLGCSVCLPSLAASQSTTPQAKMEELNQRGFELFGQGSFEQAARTFQLAYQAVPDPNLLKNESIAWYKHGDCPQAKEAASKFLKALNTTKEDQIQASRVLSQCALQDAEQAAKEKQWERADQILTQDVKTFVLDDEHKQRHATLQKNVAQALTVKPVVKPVVKPSQPPAAQKKPPQRVQKEVNLTPSSDTSLSPWVGGGLLVTGLATSVVAVILHVNALNNAQMYQDQSQGGDRARFDELGQSLDRDRILVPLLYAGGALMIGTGSYFLVRPTYDEPSARLTSPSGATVQWHVRF